MLSISKINDILFKILWNNKTPKIRRESIIAPIEVSGLKMPDIYTIHQAFKLMFIKRLCNNGKGRWKAVTWEILKIKPYIFNKKLKNIPATISNYHNQVLKIWFNTNNNMPQSVSEILNEFIFENKFILVGNEVITIKTINAPLPNSTTLLDIININGSLMTLDELNAKYEMNINNLTYNTIISAIPKEWKVKLKTENYNFQNYDNNMNIDIPHMYIKSKQKNILELESKDINNELIARKIKPLTVIDTWLDIYPFLNDIDWSLVFKLPYKTVKEPYLQTFQYKVINRLINCNYNLHKWKIKESPTCNNCTKVTDTVEHHIYSCPKTEIFWSQLSNWIENVISVKFNFTVLEIIFGLPVYYTNDYIIKAINYILLLGKWYINKCKVKNVGTYILEFKTILNSKLQTLQAIFQDQDRDLEFKNVFGSFVDHI